MYDVILITPTMVCNEVVVNSNGKGGEEMNIIDHRLYQPITTRFEQIPSLEWEC